MLDRLAVFAQFVEADTNGNGGLNMTELLAINMPVPEDVLGEDGELSFPEFEEQQNLMKLDEIGAARSTSTGDGASEEASCYVLKLKCWIFAVIVTVVVICLLLISAIVAFLTMSKKEKEANTKDVAIRHGRRLSGDGGLYATIDPTECMDSPVNTTFHLN